MNFKIDTREKFTVITPLSDCFSDSLTADFIKHLQSFLEKQISLILNFKNVNTINERFIQQIAAYKNEFYTKNLSFVLCDLSKQLMQLIKQLTTEEELNITPTENEAWDIIQIEEIERELTNDE